MKSILFNTISNLEVCLNSAFFISLNQYIEKTGSENAYGYVRTLDKESDGSPISYDVDKNNYVFICKQIGLA